MYHASVALVEPAPPDPAWPRASTRPFPPYRFVAGLNAHPRRDPKGHAYGQPETPPPYVAPERWRENASALGAGMLSAADLERIRARWREVAEPSWVGEV